MTELDVADPAVLVAIQSAADAGVPVIWLGDLPTRADGLVDAEARDAEVAALAGSLAGTVIQVEEAAEISSALLDAGVTPMLRPLAAAGARLSIAHRIVRDGDLHYVFNESFEARTEQLEVVGDFRSLALLDPDTGRAVPANLEGATLEIRLAPARGLVLSVER